MKKINVLVIGTGMYVCGRQTEGFGTIAPAILEWSKTGKLGEVSIIGRSAKGVREARAKIDELKRMFGVNLPIRYFPQTGTDPVCYKRIVRDIGKPACAIVAVPDILHKEVAMASIGEGLHTLVVKPLVPTVDDALELIRLQDKKGVYCAVEFHKRYDQANMKLRDVIGKRIIGDPLYFTIEFSQRRSMPAKIFKKWAGTTNVFQYLGIHYVDIIYFVTKAKPVRAMAIGQKNWLSSKGVDTYDSVQSAIEWRMPSGKKFVSMVSTNWVDPEATSAMSDQTIKAVGTLGRFESDQKRRGIILITDKGGIQELNPYFCTSYGEHGKVTYRGYGIDSICRFLSDVANIENGSMTTDDLEGVRPTFRQAVVSTSVLEAVNMSLRRNGEWVGVKGVKV